MVGANVRVRQNYAAKQNGGASHAAWAVRVRRAVVAS
jgi:hypothetical protein